MNTKITKTFFPKEWTREQVVEKIFEAYDNYLNRMASGEIIPLLGKDGRYKFVGLTKESMEIEIIVTQEGKIITAYPLQR